MCVGLKPKVNYAGITELEDIRNKTCIEIIFMQVLFILVHDTKAHLSFNLFNRMPIISAEHQQQLTVV